MINNPVGTGPFKFVSFQLDVSYKVVRNPDYWRKDEQGNQLPYLDAVEIIYVADPLTQKTAMQAGEADMTDMSISSGKTTADYEALGLKVITSIGASLCLIPDTAHTDSPYADKKVREAVEYAIDREAIAKAFSSGYWEAPYQIPGSACTAYNPDFTLGRKYDPEKAKQLLAEAGYPDGFKTTIAIMPIPLDRDMFVTVQSYLSEVGIQAELDFSSSFPAFLEQMNSLHSVLNAAQFIDNNANFIMPLGWILDTTSMFNKNWLRTDEFLRLFDASLAAPTPDANLIRAVTDYLVQEALATPIIGSGRAFAMQPYVMDTGFNELSYPGSWKPEQTWLNK
jgi:peptide/nickel transport system substrate-binding protein